MISRAMFGPVNAATGCPGSTSVITDVIRIWVPLSRPFARLTTGIQGWMYNLARSTVLRTAVVGTPTINISA